MGLVDRMKSESKELVFKEILGKKYSSVEDFNISYTPNEEFLLITIKRLVLEHDINEAEDVLFKALETHREENYLYIAGEFYTMLMEMDEDILNENNFSREEVFSGISDVREMFGVEI